MKESKSSARGLLFLIGAAWHSAKGAVGDVDLTFDAGPASVHPVFWVLVGKKGLPEKDRYFEVMANTPFIPTIRPGGVRRELAEVDPHGRFVRWLANKP
jgi:hypothetical protein